MNKEKSYKIYILSISFKNKTNFLKCFNLLYKKGYRHYMELSKYEHRIEIKGSLLYLRHMKEIIKLIKNCKIEHLTLKENKTYYDKKILIKEGVKL